MTSDATSEITTVLVTDLVSSTELMQQLGDEDAQDVFAAHHRSLEDAVAANGGESLQWRGDGLLCSFRSTANAVRCAIAMQKVSSRPVEGQRLRIRIGIHAGEVKRERMPQRIFGAPVIVAQQLCDRAGDGQILCSDTISQLLRGRQAFDFRSLGAADLEGVPQPIDVNEVAYERRTGGWTQTPFVGRHDEIERLRNHLDEARSGRGSVVMVAGEPGIGKSRLIEEFAVWARKQGARFLSGACYEGDWTPAYGPFIEALDTYAEESDLETLTKDIGSSGGILAILVPRLADRLTDLPKPIRLQPDEERYRLLDAVRQVLREITRRMPVVLVLGDLHWADRGTLAMLRYISRTPGLLIIGTYRDTELDPEHPLTDALRALRREAEYERILLSGLETDAIEDLLHDVADLNAPEALVHAIDRASNGNPFFIREVILHLIEEEKILPNEGRWAEGLTADEIGIPEGVRQVVQRRTARLTENSIRLLTAASAFGGAFRLDVAAGTAGLEESEALDALDEALEAQILQPHGQIDSYQFSHALIRNTLYAEMNPSRQVRLHRRIAHELERVHGTDTVEFARPIAEQYFRSAVLPGAEAGVDYCLRSADRATEKAAHEESADFLRMALELLPEGDDRRPRILGRMAIALGWRLAVDEALELASEAGERIAESEGDEAAAHYLADALTQIWGGNFDARAWKLAPQGLRYAGERRDLTWARLMRFELMRRSAEDPDSPGIKPSAPEVRQISDIVLNHPDWSSVPWLAGIPVFESRTQTLAHASRSPFHLAFYAGEYHRALDLYAEEAKNNTEAGAFAAAAANWCSLARLHIVLGNLEAGDDAFEKAVQMARRVRFPSYITVQIEGTRFERAVVRGDGFVSLAKLESTELVDRPSRENRWTHASVRAAAARVFAEIGQSEHALQYVHSVIPALDVSDASASNFAFVTHHTAAAIWLLEDRTHLDVLERNLRSKLLEPDFRAIGADPRMALGWVAALAGRWDEAFESFDRARAVLGEQGARPMLAMLDYDEALARTRRAGADDRDESRQLVERALVAFRSIGMPGWTKRAERLRDDL